eukprot:6308201-Lingulodinium_polyedra.AAC.1
MASAVRRAAFCPGNWVSGSQALLPWCHTSKGVCRPACVLTPSCRASSRASAKSVLYGTWLQYA